MTATQVQNHIQDLLAIKKSGRVEDASQKASQVAQTAQDMSWIELQQKDVYLIDISISAGKSSARLRKDNLGLSQDVLDKLEEIGSGGFSARLSKKLKEYMNQLDGLKKKLYNDYTVFVKPFRFFEASHYPEVEAAISEIQTLADACRHQLVETDYDSEFESFMLNIEDLLDVAGVVGEEKNNALMHYAEVFPSPEEFAENSLQVVINTLYKVPTLLEQARKDASLAKEIAEKENAEAKAKKSRLEIQIAEEQARLELRKQEAIARSQDAFSQSLLGALKGSVDKSRDDAYAEFATLLDRSGASSDGVKAKQGWDAAFRRLEVLSSFDASLKPMLEKAEKVRDIFFAENADMSDLEESVSAFQQTLQDSLKSERNASEGALKLSKMLSFEGQYQDLLTQLDNLKNNPDEQAIDELEGKLESIANLFEYRRKDLKKKFKEAKEATEVSLGKVEAPKAYDEDAGF